MQIDVNTLIRVIEASTKTMTVCVPSTDFYRRAGDTWEEDITFIDPQALVSALLELPSGD